MTSQIANQTIAIHIFPNTSRLKGNQIINFDQLIEYKMRNIFLKSHTENLVEQLLQDSYIKIKIEHVSGPTF